MEMSGGRTPGLHTDKRIMWTEQETSPGWRGTLGTSETASVTFLQAISVESWRKLAS